ncbi:hypothetical protein BHM03_00022055 [Ensete ventricosum]|nr:hypothetical protein BHM03_00022055 [Ensete ventricosum]
MLQTTGMDPITRRHVWDIIEDAKRGRAIVLTTHSMEEADILSDRIAIMAKGKLRCIGTAIRLKSRFGTGYIANVSFPSNAPGQTPNVFGSAPASNPHLEPVKQFFKDVKLERCSLLVTMQIPKGARFVGIPGTESSEHPRGLMVEVYWEQDDTGTLCISGHSSETDIPPNVQLTAPSRHGSIHGVPVGFVIDSNLS